VAGFPAFLGGRGLEVRDDPFDTPVRIERGCAGTALAVVIPPDGCLEAPGPIHTGPLQACSAVIMSGIRRSTIRWRSLVGFVFFGHGADPLSFALVFVFFFFSVPPCGRAPQPFLSQGLLFFSACGSVPSHRLYQFFFVGRKTIAFADFHFLPSPLPPHSVFPLSQSRGVWTSHTKAVLCLFLDTEGFTRGAFPVIAPTSIVSSFFCEICETIFS